MPQIKQMFVEQHTGHVVLLHSDGTIKRQTASQDTPGSIDWQDVAVEDLTSRAIQAGVDYRGRLTVLCQDGRLYVETPPRLGEYRRHSTWKAVEAP